MRPIEVKPACSAGDMPEKRNVFEKTIEAKKGEDVRSRPRPRD
jgi:hypothetical protein